MTGKWRVRSFVLAAAFAVVGAGIVGIAQGTSPELFGDPAGHLRRADLVARVKILSSYLLPCRAVKGNCTSVYRAEVVESFKGIATGPITFSYGPASPVFKPSSEVLILGTVHTEELVCPQDLATKKSEACVRDGMFDVYFDPDSANVIESAGDHGEQEWTVTRAGAKGKEWFAETAFMGSDPIARRADGAALWTDLRAYIRRVLAN